MEEAPFYSPPFHMSGAMMVLDAKAALYRARQLLAARAVNEAAEWFTKAEQLGADRDDCAGSRWTCAMLGGNYEGAWQESDALRDRHAPDPHRIWNGTSLVGQRVMIRSVHGYGDAVQMLRYAPLVRQQAARLSLQVAPELVGLVRCAAGIDEVLPWEQECPFDLQLEITELPYIFRSTVHSLPAIVPYLALPNDCVKSAQLILGEKTRPRVGLVWTSSAWNSSRSIPFCQLREILDRYEKAEFWCLQPKETSHDWEYYCGERGWLPHRAGDYPTIMFAALLAQMDLVITIDSFAAHVAGALGRPAWVLLQKQADWRWMTDREDSPWYPTMRLFRQQKEGEWEPVIALVARELL